jgi:DNA-binding transcriptional MerR regulator
VFLTIRKLNQGKFQRFEKNFAIENQLVYSPSYVDRWAIIRCCKFKFTIASSKRLLSDANRPSSRFLLRLQMDRFIFRAADLPNLDNQTIVDRIPISPVITRLTPHVMAPCINQKTTARAERKKNKKHIHNMLRQVFGNMIVHEIRTRPRLIPSVRRPPIK